MSAYQIGGVVLMLFVLDCLLGCALGSLMRWGLGDE